jgi:hypothetical protein
MLFVNAKYCDCKSGIIKKDKGVHSDGGWNNPTVVFG